jgi:uncharacterized protein with PQ loop repeat
MSADSILSPRLSTDDYQQLDSTRRCSWIGPTAEAGAASNGLAELAERVLHCGADASDWTHTAAYVPEHRVYAVSSLTEALAVTAGGFGVVMGASPLLQALHSHRRESSSDVSLAFLVVLICGATLWLLYGLALGNAAIIVANIVGVLSSSATLAVTLRWRRRAPSAGRENR